MTAHPAIAIEDGADAAPRANERRCIATGAVEPREGLVRFVAGPDGTIVPDIDERLPGRGIWVTARREALTRAVAKHLFAKAAGRSVNVPSDLVDRVASLLAARAVSLLALARRAGAAVGGYEKVRVALGQGRAGLVLEASDAGVDARRRLGEAGRQVATLRVLTGAELAGAFQPAFMAHVAIAPGRLAHSIERECLRLAGFRPAAGGEIIETGSDG